MDSVSNSLVDYFFVCGLDYNIGLDSYDVTNESDESSLFLCLPPLRRPYKPSIIQKFPEHCGSYAFPEDYAITSLCMPNGLRLLTDPAVMSHPVNHNFIVIREDASRIYGVALLFLEEIEHEDIKLAVTDLQKMYQMGHGQHSCCSECKNLTPDTPGDSGGRDSGTFSGSGTSFSTIDFWYDEDKLYTVKAIGLLSQHPYIQCHQSWLYDIWLMVFNQQKVKLSSEPQEDSSSDVDLDPKDIKLEVESKINIESFIYNILFEIDAPKRGKSIVLDGPMLKHFCRCPDSNEFPPFELPMRGLLEILGLENLIRVYSCILLEYRVVILSQDYRLLMLAAECITCLLFPFVWSHVYAPILPLAARHFLNAPLPFIMGINLGQCEDEESIQLASDASVCYVNVDKQNVITSDDIPIFPYEHELRREITELLVHSIDGYNQQVKPLYTYRNPMSPRPTDRIPYYSESKPNSASKPPRGFGHSKPVADNNVQFENLVDISKSVDSRRRSSHSGVVALAEIKTSPCLRLPKDAGISIHDIMEVVLKSDSDMSEQISKAYFGMMKFNNILRDIFLNHFLHIFYDYEQYIISPKEGADVSTYLSDRESAVQNFDKASFLSEQPETHLPFLSAFLETQMFASFIDMKMLEMWNAPHPNITLFGLKLRNMKNINSRLQNNPNSEIIGFRPYRSYLKSSSILPDADKSFNLLVDGSKILKPEISPHILSCNKSPITSCSQSSRFCVQHHHHHREKVSSTNDKDVKEDCSLGTNFPILQGDCLRNKPRKKSITKQSEVKICHYSQTVEIIQNTTTQPSPRIRHKPHHLLLNKTEPPDTNALHRHTLGCNSDFVTQKENRVRLDPRPYLPNIVPNVMAQNHWAFVNALLQETKAKTKRMVLEKMGGQEAVELGHGDIFVSGIEENTLVAGLCDLLERIWCHGLNQKHGKSALWTHLIRFVEREQDKFVIKRTNKENTRRGSTTDNKEEAGGELFGSLKQMKINSGSQQNVRSSTPDFISKTFATPNSGVSDLFFNWNQNLMGSLGRGGLKAITNSGSSRNIDLISIFGPQRKSLVADVKAIKSMTDIKTDVGLARAFVRLALEKKLLSEHLKKLLSDTNLLRELYKRHAFLRCEEEREQFLFHLLALQAVDYYSFTNLYIKSQLLYRVFIYSGKKFSSGSSTTANAWFCINGQHCNSGQRSLPKGLYQFEFENQNLGILTTMRIGHDNGGLSPKWFIDFVLVQNVITGHVYKFPCNHWLGKGVDDGSTERLLVGEVVRMNDDEINNESRGNKISILGINTPPSSRSPSLSRKINDGKSLSEVSQIQEQLGDSVNCLVKYFCWLQDREKIASNNLSSSCHVTLLLCGEGGLVSSMEKVFMFGFRSSRLFQKKFFIWDFLEKVCVELTEDLNNLGNNSMESVKSSVKFTGTNICYSQKFCKLVDKISHISQSVGKDGKFQRFVCIGVRDHMFPEWINLLGLVDCTQQYYEESSFFREPKLREFLIKILTSLNEFTFSLESALTDGL